MLLLAQVWVYMAVAFVCGIGAVCIVVYSVHVNEKDVKLRIADAKQKENTRAHRWIIGYGTITTTGTLYALHRRLRT